MSQAPSRSPTPVPESPPPTNRPNSQQQQKDLRHDCLLAQASQLVGYPITGVPEADLEEIINIVRADQAPAVEAPQRYSKVSI
jgi:hypothetical protein